MSTIIFDFDGTIADTLGVTIDTLHILLNRTDDPATPQEIEKIRGLTFLGAAKELNVPLWKIPYLAAKGPRMAHRRMATVPPCKGMPELIKKLHAQGHHMYILSTNTHSNITLFLGRHNLDGIFLRIYSDVGAFSKAHRLKEIMKQNHMDASDVTYVGDETRDMHAAKHAHVRSVAVTWGYNNATVLRAQHPDAMVDTAGELFSLFSETKR